MTSLMSAVLFFLFTFSISADSILYANGKILEDVKILVKKDLVEIRYQNQRTEIRDKSELKKSKIKFRPVTWNEKESPQSKAFLKETRQAKINEQMLILERQREANFAISQKVIEERKKLDSLLKERVRLQYTEGFLTYAGGQSIYTEIMEKNGNRFYVRNPYGLLYFTAKDFGDEMIIETDRGKEKLDIKKILAVKDEKYQSGYIYLAGGERFKGTIVKSLGEMVVINTPKGEMKIAPNEILFPSFASAKKTKEKLNLREGDSGSFLFENGETIKGILTNVSKNFLLIDTEYGRIQMDLNTLTSFTKETLVE